MKPIVVIPGKKPIVMEVIGENGLKVAEYVDKGDDKKMPYQQLQERVTL